MDPDHGDQHKCFHTGCDGTMTYYERIKVNPSADPPVQPDDTIGPKRNAGWICDADIKHVHFDKD